MTIHTQEILVTVLPWVIPFVCRTTLLSAALWVLLRGQSLNYTLPGLLGSAALASACDMIPVVGHYVAVPVLLLCVLKLTHSHFVDVRFTVVISYALMFLLQMLIMSALPSDITAFARATKTDDALQAAADKDDAKSDTTNDLRAVAGKDGSTNAADSAQKAQAAPVVARPSKPGAEAAKNFRLKGVSAAGQNSSVMVDTGVRTYTIYIGEKVVIETPMGKTDVVLQQATENSAVMSVGGEPVSLRIK